ncbi:PEP-CTERM sorting domain-containing protein [Hydrogenophaga sp.]|uniref:PEP-CTERM sorting domain-containing protein n=1 Tax=Hydrogenophaga sp. TaxID=1904254 RepID=UPI00272684BC|nr:PEP-CTERM sorting domain-containing protein [Hydrogenophaga sp.]MDO9133206.1 PEP-CTERM sorting domain-containing protein [Hydrogenophaga sp.]
MLIKVAKTLSAMLLMVGISNSHANPIKLELSFNNNASYESYLDNVFSGVRELPEIFDGISPKPLSCVDCIAGNISFSIEKNQFLSALSSSTELPVNVSGFADLDIGTEASFDYDSTNIPSSALAPSGAIYSLRGYVQMHVPFDVTYAYADGPRNLIDLNYLTLFIDFSTANVKSLIENNRSFEIDDFRFAINPLGSTNFIVGDQTGPLTRGGFYMFMGETIVDDSVKLRIINEVPEPSTILLLLMGLAFAAVIRLTGMPENTHAKFGFPGHQIRHH